LLSCLFGCLFGGVTGEGFAGDGGIFYEVVAGGVGAVVGLLPMGRVWIDRAGFFESVDLAHEAELMAGAVEGGAADAVGVGALDEELNLRLATVELFAEPAGGARAGAAGDEVGREGFGGGVFVWIRTVHPQFHVLGEEAQGRGADAAGYVGGENAGVGRERIGA